MGVVSCVFKQGVVTLGLSFIIIIRVKQVFYKKRKKVGETDCKMASCSANPHMNWLSYKYTICKEGRFYCGGDVSHLISMIHCD